MPLSCALLIALCSAGACASAVPPNERERMSGRAPSARAASVEDPLDDVALDRVPEPVDQVRHVDRASGRELFEDAGDEGAVPRHRIEPVVLRPRDPSGVDQVAVGVVGVTADPAGRVRVSEQVRELRPIGEAGVEDRDSRVRPWADQLARRERSVRGREPRTRSADSPCTGWT